MIWKYVFFTLASVATCAAFLGVNLGLDWVAENYKGFYKWATAASVLFVFSVLIAEAFFVFADWHVIIFIILSFPALHRAIWLQRRVSS